MDDCETFLAEQKPWVSAALKGEYWSPEILRGLGEPGGIKTFNKALDDYEKLLKQCPEHLSAYRKREAKIAAESTLRSIPSLRPGRRRQDHLAQEAAQLAREGLSHSKIADELNRRYPDRKDRKANRSPVTKEAVRKMLSRGRTVTPDKT
ncbi:MAG: hypothetical protein WBQ63_15790 [Candidatus Acidiferrales bacterium]